MSSNFLTPKKGDKGNRATARFMPDFRTVQSHPHPGAPPPRPPLIGAGFWVETFRRRAGRRERHRQALRRRLPVLGFRPPIVSDRATQV
jgi:hypothetical protein